MKKGIFFIASFFFCLTLLGQSSDFFVNHDNSSIKADFIEIEDEERIIVERWSDEIKYKTAIELSSIKYLVRDKVYFKVIENEGKFEIVEVKNSIWEAGSLIEKGGKNLRAALIVGLIGGISGGLLLVPASAAGIGIISGSGLTALILNISGQSKIIKGGTILRFASK